MTDTSGTTKSPKGPAAHHNPKTATITEVDVEDQEENKKEKPLKEVPVVQDTGFFYHETGDTYDGRFEIKKKDLSLKMHGPGVYTTAEGDSYSGYWDSNLLDHKEPAIVSYNDGAKFEGFLKDFCYNGRGKYTYPDGSVLTSDFHDNCPVGNLILTDPNGHTWLGKAEQGYAWCSPVNHFYDMLETTTTKTKRRRKHVPVPVPDPPESHPAAAPRKGAAAARNDVSTAKPKTKKG